MALPAIQGSTEVPGNSRGLGGVKPGKGVASKESCGDIHGGTPSGGDGSSSAPAPPGMMPSSGDGGETSPATDAEGFLIPDPLPLPSSTGSVSAGTAAAGARSDQKKDEIATRGRRRSDSPQSGTAASQQTPLVPQATPTTPGLNGLPSSSLQALASSFATNPPSPIPPSLHTMMNNTFAAHNAAASSVTSASLSPQPQPSLFQGVGGGASFPSAAAAAAAALATSATLPGASPLSSSPQPSLVNVSSNLLNLAASGVVSSPSAAALLSAALARTAPGTTFPFSSPLLVQKPSFAATPRPPFPAQSLSSFVPTPTSLMAAALKNAGSPAFSLQSLQQLQQTRLLAPHLDPTVMATPQSHPSLRAGALNPNSLFPTHQAAAASHTTPLGGASNLLVTPSGGLVKSNTVIGAPLLSPLSAACQGLTLTAGGVHPGVGGPGGGQALPQLATTTGKVEPLNRTVSPPSQTETGSNKGVVNDEKTATTSTPAGGTTFPGEEDGVCSVCVVGECEQQNNIVFCDGCGCAVHQFCYGVVEIPEGPWYCSLCTWIRKSNRKTGSEQQQRGGSGGSHNSSQQQATSHPSGTTSTGENQNKVASSSSSSDSAAGGGEEGIEKDVSLEASSITCRLCGKSGGAMRRGPEKLWVHSCCVLFCRSGPQFRKTLQLDEPVDIRASLAVARAMGWRCAICTKREGYPIPCGFRGCQNRVHVTCAREKRCVCVITSLWEGEAEGVGRERVWKAVFCPSHNDLRSIELAKQFEREKLFSHSLPPGGGTPGAPVASPSTTRSAGSLTTAAAEAVRLHLMQNGPGVLQPEKADGGIHALLNRGDDTAAASAISALGAQALAATSSHAAASETSARRLLSVTPRPPATPSSQTLAGFPGGQQQGLGLTLIPQAGRLLGSGDDAVTRAGTLASSLRLGTPSASPFGPLFAHPQCGGGAAASLTADALQKQLLQQARVLSAKTTAALSLEQLGGGAATTPAGGAATSASRLAGPAACLAGVFTPGGETPAGSGNAGILGAGGVGVASQPGTAAFIQPHSAAVQTAAVLNGAGLNLFSPHQLLGQPQAVVAGGGKTTACGGIGSVLTSSPLSSQQSSFELSTNTSSSLHASSHSVESNTASAILPSSALKPLDSNKAATSTVMTTPLSDTAASAKTLSQPLHSTLLGSSRSGSGPAPPTSDSDMVVTASGLNASSPPAPSSSSSTSLSSSSPLPALRAGSKRGVRGRLHRPVVLSSYKNRHSSSVPASSMTASSAANRLGPGPPLGGGGTGPGGGGAHSGTAGGGVRGGGMSGVSGGDIPDGADITGTAAGTQVHAAATRGSRVHWGRFDALFRRVAVGPFADSVLETFKTSQERRVAVEEARAIESILGAPPVCPDAKALLHPPLEDQEVVESLLEMYIKEVEAAVKKSRESKRTRMRTLSKEKRQKKIQPGEEIAGGDSSGGGSSSRSDKSDGKSEAQQEEKAEISNGIVQTVGRHDSEPVLSLKQSQTSGSAEQKEASGQEEENVCSRGGKLASPASSPVSSGSCNTVEALGSSDDRNDNVPSASMSDTHSMLQDAQQKRKPPDLAENLVSGHGEEKQEGRKSSSESCEFNTENIMVGREEEEDENEAEEEISLPLTALVDFGPIAAWLLFEAVPADGQSSDYQEQQAVIEQFCNSGLSCLALSQSTSSSKSKGHTTTTGLSMADPFRGGGTGSSSVLSFSSTNRLHGPPSLGASISPTNPRGAASGVSSGNAVSSRGGAPQPGSGIQLRISPYSHMGTSGAGGSGRRTSSSSSSVGGGGGGVSSGLVQEYVSRVVNPGYSTEGGVVAPSHSSENHRDTSVRTAIEGDRCQRSQQRNGSSTSGRLHVGRGTRERDDSAWGTLTTTEEDTSSSSSTSSSASVVRNGRCRLTVKAFKILTFYQLTYCRRRLQQVLLRPEKHPLYQQALKAEKQQRERRDQLAKLGEFEEEEARVLPLIKLCSLLSERGIDATLVEKEVVQHAKEITDTSSASSSSSSSTATTTNVGFIDTAKGAGSEVGKTSEGHSSSAGNDSSAGGSIPSQAVGDQTSSNNSNIHQVDGSIISGEKNSSSEVMSTVWPNGSVLSNSNTPVSRQLKKSVVDPSPDTGGGSHASPCVSMALLNSTPPPLGVQQTTTAGVEGAAHSSLADQLFPGSSRSLKKQRVGESAQPSVMSSSSSGSVSIGETSSTETFSTQQQSILMRITAPAGGGDGILGGGGDQSKGSVGIGYRTGTLPSFEAGVGPGGTGENGASVVMVGGHRWYIRPWGWEGSPYADLVGGEDDFVGIQCAQFLQVSSVLSQDLRRLKFHLLQSVLEENRQPLKIVDRPQSSDHLLARYASMHRWSQLRQHVCEGVKDILPPPPVPPPPPPCLPPVPSSSSATAGVPSSSSSQATGAESGKGGADDLPSSPGVEGRRHHEAGRRSGGDNVRTQNIEGEARRSLNTSTKQQTEDSCSPSSSKHDDKHPPGRSSSSLTSGPSTEGIGGVASSEKNSQDMTGGTSSTTTDQGSSTSSAVYGRGEILTPPVRLLDSCTPPEKQKESYSQRRQLYESKALQVSSATDANVCALLLQQQQKLQHQLGCLTDPVASVAGAAGWGLGSMGVATSTASEVERRLLLVLSSSPASPTHRPNNASYHDDLVTKDRGGDLGESPSSASPSLKRSGEETEAEAENHADNRHNTSDDYPSIPTAISKSSCAVFSSPSSSASGTTLPGKGRMTTMIAHGETTGNIEGEDRTPHQSTSPLRHGEGSQRDMKSYYHHHSDGGGGMKGGSGMDNFELSVDAFLAHGEEEEKRFREKKQPVLMAPGVINPQGRGETPSSQQNPASSSSPIVPPRYPSSTSDIQVGSTPVPCNNSPSHHWRKDHLKGDHSSGRNSNKSLPNASSHHVDPDNLPVSVGRGDEQQQQLKEDSSERKEGEGDLSKKEHEKEAAPVCRTDDTKTSTSCLERNEKDEKGREDRIVAAEKECEGGKEEQGGEKKTTEETPQQDKMFSGSSKEERTTGDAIDNKSSQGENKEQEQEAKKNDERKCQEGDTNSSSNTPSSPSITSTAGGTPADPSSSSSSSQQVSENRNASVSLSSQQEKEEAVDSCNDQEGKRRTPEATSHHPDTTAVPTTTHTTIAPATGSYDKETTHHWSTQESESPPPPLSKAMPSLSNGDAREGGDNSLVHNHVASEAHRDSSSNSSSSLTSTSSPVSPTIPPSSSPQPSSAVVDGTERGEGSSSSTGRQQQEAQVPHATTGGDTIPPSSHSLLSSPTPPMFRSSSRGGGGGGVGAAATGPSLTSPGQVTQTTTTTTTPSSGASGAGFHSHSSHHSIIPAAAATVGTGAGNHSGGSGIGGILDGMTAGGALGTTGGGLCNCCCVCWLSERSHLNPILSCLRCLVTVHKNCYGVGKTGETIEGDDWICRRCEFEKKGLGTQWMVIFEPMKIQCQICGLGGGALKPTIAGNTWVHVFCALWLVPEATCLDYATLEPWNLDGVAQWRKDARCRLCDQEVGYCVRCAEVGCEVCFHPMCAWLSGLSCEAESLRGLFLSFRGSVDRCFPRLVVRAYCYKHSPEFLADGRRRSSAVQGSLRRRRYVTRDHRPDLFSANDRRSGGLLFKRGPGGNRRGTSGGNSSGAIGGGQARGRASSAASSSSSSLFSASPGPATTPVVGYYPGVSTPQIPPLLPPPPSTPGGIGGGGSGDTSLSSGENHIETGGGGNQHARTTTGGEATGVREGGSLKEAPSASNSRSRNNSTNTSSSTSPSQGGCLASEPSSSSASSVGMNVHHDCRNVLEGDGKLSSASTVEDRNQNRSDTNKMSSFSPPSSSPSGGGDPTSSSTSQGEDNTNETEKTSTIGTSGAAPSSTIATTSDDTKVPPIVAHACGGEGSTSSSSNCCHQDRKCEDHHDDSGDDQIRLAEGEGQVMDDEELSAILQGEENVILEDCDLYEDHCCAVCLLPRVTCTTTNPFFHCERCGLCVHRQCYGIKKEDLPLHLRPDLLKKLKPSPRSIAGARTSHPSQSPHRHPPYGKQGTLTATSQRPTTPGLSLTGGEKLHENGKEEEGKRQQEQDTSRSSDEKNEREGARADVGSERKESLDVEMSSASPDRQHHASAAKENEEIHVSSSSMTEGDVGQCSSSFPSSSSTLQGSPSHRPDRTTSSSSPLGCSVHDDQASDAKKRKRESLPLQPPHHRRTVEDIHSETEVIAQGDRLLPRKEEDREGDLRSREDEGGEPVSKRQALVKQDKTGIEDRKKITQPLTVETSSEMEEDGGTEEASSVSKEAGVASVPGREERDKGRSDEGGEERSSHHQHSSSTSTVRMTTTTVGSSTSLSVTAGGVEKGLKAKKGVSLSEENAKKLDQQDEEEDANATHSASPLTPGVSTAGGEAGEGTMEEKDLDYKPKPFLCEACTWLPPREKPFCLLCPRRGGAFKLVIPSVPPYILPSPISPTSHQLATTTTTTSSGGLPSSTFSSSPHSQSSCTRGSPSHHHHQSSNGGGVHTQQQQPQQSQYPSPPYLRPSFAHMTCCLWAPGVDVAATPALSPIVGVDRVLRQQRQLLLQHQRRNGKLVRGLPASNSSSSGAHMDQPLENPKETSAASSLDSQQRSSDERGGGGDGRGMPLRGGEEIPTKIGGNSSNLFSEGGPEASHSSRSHQDSNVKIGETPGSLKLDTEKENHGSDAGEQEQQVNLCKLVEEGEQSRKKKGMEGISGNQSLETSLEKDRESREEAPEGHEERSPTVEKGVAETTNSPRQDEMSRLAVGDAGQKKVEEEGAGSEGVFGERDMKEKKRREGEEEREELMVASPLPNSSHDRTVDFHKQLSVIERNGQEGREMRETREKTGDRPRTKNTPNLLLWGECEVCGLSYGYCMKCSQKGCKQFFHPLCVQLKGGFMEMTEQPGRKFTAVAFCMAHSFVRNQISPSVRLFLRLRSFLELSRLLVGQVSRRERAKRVWLKKRRELLDAEFPLTFASPFSSEVFGGRTGAHALEKALTSSAGGGSTTVPGDFNKHNTEDNRGVEKIRSSRESETSSRMESSLGGERDVEKSSPCSSGNDVSKNVPLTEERKNVPIKTTSTSLRTTGPGKLVLPLKSKSKTSTSGRGLVDQHMEDASLLARLNIGDAMAAAREAAAQALRHQHALTRGGEEETRAGRDGEQEVSRSRTGKGKDVGSLRRKAAGSPGVSLPTSVASQPQQEGEDGKTSKKGIQADISPEGVIVAGGGGSPISSSSPSSAMLMERQASSSGRYQKTAGDDLGGLVSRSSRQQASNDARTKEGAGLRGKTEIESSTSLQTPSSSCTGVTSAQTKKQEERNHAGKSGSDSRGEDANSHAASSNKGSTSSFSASGVQQASLAPPSKSRHVIIVDPNNDKEEEEERRVGGGGGVVDLDGNRSASSSSSTTTTQIATTPNKKEFSSESLGTPNPSEGRKGDNTEAVMREKCHPSSSPGGLDSTPNAHRRNAGGVGALKTEGRGVGKAAGGGGGIVKGLAREERSLEGMKKSEDDEEGNSRSRNGERGDLPYIDEKTGFRCTKLSEEELREVLLLAAEQQQQQLHQSGGGGVGGTSEGKTNSSGGGGAVMVKKGRPTNRHRLLVLLSEGSLHSRREAMQIAVHMKKTWEDILLGGVTMKGTTTTLGKGGETQDTSNKQRHSLHSHTPSAITRKPRGMPLVYTVPSTPASPTHVSHPQASPSSSSPVFLPKGFRNPPSLPPLDNPDLKEHSLISSSPVHHHHKRPRPLSTATKNTPPLSSQNSHGVSSSSAAATGGTGDTESIRTSRSSLSSAPSGAKTSSLQSQEGTVGKSPRMTSAVHRHHQGTRNDNRGSTTAVSEREEVEEDAGRRRSSSSGSSSSVGPSLTSSSAGVKLLSAPLVETSIEDEQAGTSSSHAEGEDVIKMKRKDDSGSTSSSNVEMEEGMASKRLKRTVAGVGDRGGKGGEQDEDLKKIKKGRSDGGQGTSTRCTPPSTTVSRKVVLKEEKEELRDKKEEDNSKEEVTRREGAIEEMSCSDGETEKKRSPYPNPDESDSQPNEPISNTTDTRMTKEKKKNSPSSSAMTSFRTSESEDGSIAIVETGRGVAKKSDNRESGEDGVLLPKTPQEVLEKYLPLFVSVVSSSPLFTATASKYVSCVRQGDGAIHIQEEEEGEERGEKRRGSSCVEAKKNKKGLGEGRWCQYIIALLLELPSVNTAQSFLSASKGGGVGRHPVTTIDIIPRNVLTSDEVSSKQHQQKLSVLILVYMHRLKLSFKSVDEKGKRTPQGMASACQKENSHLFTGGEKGGRGGASIRRSPRENHHLICGGLAEMSRSVRELSCITPLMSPFLCNSTPLPNALSSASQLQSTSSKTGGRQGLHTRSARASSSPSETTMVSGESGGGVNSGVITGHTGGRIGGDDSTGALECIYTRARRCEYPSWRAFADEMTGRLLSPRTGGEGRIQSSSSCRRRSISRSTGGGGGAGEGAEEDSTCEISAGTSSENHRRERKEKGVGGGTSGEEGGGDASYETRRSAILKHMKAWGSLVEIALTDNHQSPSTEREQEEQEENTSPVMSSSSSTSVGTTMDGKDGGGLTKEERKKNDGLPKQMKRNEGRKGWSSWPRLSDWLESLHVEKWPSVEGYDASLPSPWVLETIPPKGLDAIGRRVALYSAQMQVWLSGVVIYCDNRGSSESASHHPQHVSDHLSPGHNKEGGGDHHVVPREGVVTERKRGREDNSKRLRGDSSSSSLSIERDTPSVSGEGNLKSSHNTSKRGSQHSSKISSPHDELNHRGGGEEKVEGAGVETGDKERTGHSSQEKDVGPHGRKKEDEKPKKRGRKGSTQEELSSLEPKPCCMTTGGDRYLIAFDDDQGGNSAWVDFNGISDIVLFDNSALSLPSTAKNEGDKQPTLQNWMEAYRRRVSKRQQQAIDEHLSSSSGNSGSGSTRVAKKTTHSPSPPTIVSDDPPSGNSQNTSRGREAS